MGTMVSFRSSVSRVTPANRKGINTTIWVFLSPEVETIKQLLRVADSFGHKLLSSFANDVHYTDGPVFTNGQPCTTELKADFNPNSSSWRTYALLQIAVILAQLQLMVDTRTPSPEYFRRAVCCLTSNPATGSGVMRGRTGSVAPDRVAQASSESRPVCAGSGFP